MENWIKRNPYDDAWLGLGDTSKIQVKNNPLLYRSERDLENPGLHEIRVMRNPDYLYFVSSRDFDK